MESAFVRSLSLSPSLSLSLSLSLFSLSLSLSLSLSIYIYIYIYIYIIYIYIYICIPGGRVMHQIIGEFVFECVLSCLGKLFCSILNQRLLKHVRSHNIL